MKVYFKKNGTVELITMLNGKIFKRNFSQKADYLQFIHALDVYLKKNNLRLG